MPFESIGSAESVLESSEERVIKNTYVSLGTLERDCEGDSLLESLLQEMYILCDRYAETVCRFEQIVLKGKEAMTSGEREEIDRVRSTTHDAAISSIKILARSLKKAGKDSSWINDVDNSGRAGYFKFAVTTAFERSRTVKQS